VGGKEDFLALSKIINCSVRVIATIHGFDVGDVQKRTGAGDIFERFIVLGKNRRVGVISQVLDSCSNNIMQ